LFSASLAASALLIVDTRSVLRVRSRAIKKGQIPEISFLTSKTGALYSHFALRRAARNGIASSRTQEPASVENIVAFMK